MPELPEVQTVVDALRKAGLTGKQVCRASVYWPKTIATSTPQWFCRRIKEKRIRAVRRRGKYIILDLSQGFCLIVHLRMTGRFDLAPSVKSRPRHAHVILDLDDDQRLIFHDTRKFGRFYLTKDEAHITGRLGPEPLGADFTANAFRMMLKARRRRIKPLLLDQGFLAGLGNIYVDEALWASGIHPQRSAHTLDLRESKSLHRSIRQVLRRAIANAGTSLGNGLGNYAWLNQQRGRNRDALKVYRRTGQACLRCGHPVERIVVGQRSTHICITCQK